MASGCRPTSLRVKHPFAHQRARLFFNALARTERQVRGGHRAVQRRRDENLRRRVEEPCDRRQRRGLFRAFFGQSGVVEERIDEVGRCTQNTSFVILIARMEIK